MKKIGDWCSQEHEPNPKLNEPMFILTLFCLCFIQGNILKKKQTNEARVDICRWPDGTVKLVDWHLNMCCANRLLLASLGASLLLLAAAHSTGTFSHQLAVAGL